jgi:hypothetical protein
MSKNNTLDRIDFDKLTENAKVARAEYLRQHGAAANMVFGSKLRSYRVPIVIAIPRTVTRSPFRQILWTTVRHRPSPVPDPGPV